MKMIDDLNKERENVQALRRECFQEATRTLRSLEGNANSDGCSVAKDENSIVVLLEGGPVLVPIAIKNAVKGKSFDLVVGGKVVQITFDHQPSKTTLDALETALRDAVRARF
jgi:hypothetical protein